MKTALILVSALAFAGTALAADPPKTQATPQSKSQARSQATKTDASLDRLRTESVKADAKTQAGKLGAVLDINSASAPELAKLPGIGEARAKAIVKGRPYRGKDDLVRRKILPDNVYRNVEDVLIARRQ